MEEPIDDNIFTLQNLNFGTNGTPATLDIQTDDYAKVGEYILRLAVYYDAYKANSKYSKDFMIKIEDYCTPNSV